MVDKILGLRAKYVSEMEKLAVKIEVLDDLVGFFADDVPVAAPVEEVVETEEVVEEETVANEFTNL